MPTIPTTTTPFLYQTKTLFALYTTPVRTSLLHRRNLHLFPSSFHSHCIPRSAATNRSINTNGGPRIIRTTQAHRPHKQSSIPWALDATDGDGIEEMEDGNPRDFFISRSVDFEKEDKNLFHDRDDIKNLTNLSDPQTGRESTITPSERYAFQRIFSDILAKSQAPPIPREAIIKAAGADKRTAIHSKLDSILGAAMEVKNRRLQSNEEKRAAVERYPPALRAAAARAIGLQDEVVDIEDVIEAEETALDIDQLEKLRGPERQRVEALMRGARSDFELWRVMEREVFTLINKLGLKEPVKAFRVPLKKVTSRKKTRKEAAMGEEPKPDTVMPTYSFPESGVRPVALYGPLYPSYLLLGLRLLDRSFSKPSPLTLNILPKIKSLGIVSNVLGASTPLYNELLRIYWFRYDDFRRVISLLKEMDAEGLEYDNETFEVVSDILTAQRSVAQGERGETLKMLWTLPEFAPNKFPVLGHKIKQAIQERSEGATF
ncbi:hypothetical protein B7494_g6571 [Chlorociboria aeruginascens]|nr:hypothetical protein B7494_g6571 [Chlorociboria aeruginascens]